MIVAGYRKMTGLTQAEMSKRLGISEGTYRNKEKGISNFKDNEMKKFYELVSQHNKNVSFENIFFVDEPTHTDEMKGG